jgi:hypothetical protein
MSEKKKTRNAEREGIASQPLARMSIEERREIQKLVQRALDEHNLPKFKAALLKLGYDETSAAYGRLMQLWDEHDRASRHG